MTRRFVMISGVFAVLCLLAVMAVVPLEADEKTRMPAKKVTPETAKKVTPEIAKVPPHHPPLVMTRLTYEGLVVDDQNKPLEGIKVKAKGPATYTETTNAQGVFTFTNMIPGEYKIHVWSDQHIIIKVPMYNKFTMTEAPL